MRKCKTNCDEDSVKGERGVGGRRDEGTKNETEVGGLGEAQENRVRRGTRGSIGRVDRRSEGGMKEMVDEKR